MICCSKLLGSQSDGLASVYLQGHCGQNKPGANPLKSNLVCSPPLKMHIDPVGLSGRKKICHETTVCNKLQSGSIGFLCEASEVCTGVANSEGMKNSLVPE